MSELRVDSVKSKGGGAPDLPKGVTISGITTAATLGATQIDVSNVNVSGVVTSGTLSGELLSTGTPTLGLGVTINSSGVAISGVATAGIVSATTLYGDGSNITGIAATLAPLFYNPDTSDQVVTVNTGIGITFNQQIKAGSGNITLRKDSASGAVVENFGVGSSVTISENTSIINPTSSLTGNSVYHISYPSGCFTNNEGESYAGTAYTFSTLTGEAKYFVWGSQAFGSNNTGHLGLNNLTQYSSPVQLPGTTWSKIPIGADDSNYRSCWATIKTDGTLWTWGNNYQGQLGQNQQNDSYTSSPAQVGSNTTWAQVAVNNGGMVASKTDGTLWSWGYGGWVGWLGENARYNRSSPIQVPGFSGASAVAGKVSVGNRNWLAIKTNGELWACGNNNEGSLGINKAPGTTGATPSSPVQIPGTNWNTVLSRAAYWAMGGKTDGTLWVWGGAVGGSGRSGDNGAGANQRSSPAQVPGTDWVTDARGYYATTSTIAAIKTDGTLWTWGNGSYGLTAQNDNIERSSPIQVGTDTNWSKIGGGSHHFLATKTDGTLWTWGANEYDSNQDGALGLNNRTNYSSPIQIGSHSMWTSDQIGGRSNASFVMLEDTSV